MIKVHNVDTEEGRKLLLELLERHNCSHLIQVKINLGDIPFPIMVTTSDGREFTSGLANHGSTNRYTS